MGIWDTIDEVVFGNYIRTLPQFRGYDKETREFGKFGVLYLWHDNKWLTQEETRVSYRKIHA